MTPEGAAHSYATYAFGICMGILTNIVLELVLVCRVHLLGGVPGGPSPRTLKVLRYAVWCQLAPLAVFMIVMSEAVRKSNVAAPLGCIVASSHSGTGSSTTTSRIC